jgi:hypothetical protein
MWLLVADQRHGQLAEQAASPLPAKVAPLHQHAAPVRHGQGQSTHNFSPRAFLSLNDQVSPT